MKIISGNSNRNLAESIGRYLNLPLCAAEVRCFSDNEIYVEILENVRGENVFVVQSTSAPVNDNIMELLIMLDALRRASAKTVTVIIPYFGYARQDRKVAPRSPISAKLIANLIVKSGADRVVTLDLHAGQIQGFFDIPTDNIFAEPVFASDVSTNYLEHDRLTIVSPDVGGVFRARCMAKRLHASLAIVDKRRERQGVSEVMNIIGDVKGQKCILIDDIADSAGTLCNAAKALSEAGADSVSAYVTHGVFSGDAVDRVEKSCLAELVVTDSISARDSVRVSSRIRRVSVAPLLADVLKRISLNKSVSSIFV